VVGILGYAFLPDSDDTRNTPANSVIEEFSRRGVSKLRIHDPYVRAEELPKVQRNLYEVAKNADCLCIVTGHSEYRTIDYEKLKHGMNNHILVDGRNILERSNPSLETHFTVRTIGTGSR